MNGLGRGVIGLGKSSVRKSSRTIKSFKNKASLEEAFGTSSQSTVRQRVRMDILRASVLVPIAMKVVSRVHSSALGDFPLSHNL